MPSYDTSNMIDLGRECDCLNTVGSKATKEVMYPDMYVRGLKEDMELPDGEFYFVGKGRVVERVERLAGKGNRKESYDCEIQILEMKPLGPAKASKKQKAAPEEGLDSALTAIESEKSEAEDE